jgi:hypothetical protein
MFDRAQLEHLHEVVGEWVRLNCAPQCIEQAEQMADAIARAAGAAAVDAMLPSLAGQKSYSSSRLACECGGKARFVSYRSRGIGTLYGVVSVQRAYYHCRSCRKGRAPWDAKQGLDDRLWTPRVKALVTELGAQMPYQRAVDILRATLGFAIEDSSAAELMVEVGARLRCAENELAADIEGGEISPLVSRAPQRLYVSMDGTSAHIDGSWHEVKTGVVYEGRSGPDGIDRLHGASYVAAQEPAQAFGSRLYMIAAQAGVQVAQGTVVLGDGAEWIWNLAAHHYLDATQILDLWHACEHIHALARVCYGEGDKRGQRWAREHCRRLKEHGPKRLLRALKRMKPATAEQIEALRREQGYFQRNAARMAYPQYRQQGMMVGSGPVEAACKAVVGARLKQSGMRWSEEGADAVLATRAALMSGRVQLINQAAKAA